MSLPSLIPEDCRVSPRRWLVTGAAGFIGSHLVETLLSTNQIVVGLDNFTTGRQSNVDLALQGSGHKAVGHFSLIQGDVRSMETCRQACAGADFVLHQAAQVSVPASMADPRTTHEVNVTGFLNLMLAAREAGVQRLVYASSCAVYGDSPRLPLSEEELPRPLSPYASSKLADEAYAAALAPAGGPEAVGLRYFNVFGPRQDPRGAYAAVIPAWIAAMIRKEPVRIHGDGSTTRDFCHVTNVVQANLLAAGIPLRAGPHEVVNVAAGGRTTLEDLFELIRARLLPACPHLNDLRPVHEPFRPGDIRHSQASLARAKQRLGYAPVKSVAEGLTETVSWFKAEADAGRA